jgi:hypothetical protein
MPVITTRRILTSGITARPAAAGLGGLAAGRAPDANAGRIARS